MLSVVRWPSACSAPLRGAVVLITGAQTLSRVLIINSARARAPRLAPDLLNYLVPFSL